MTSESAGDWHLKAWAKHLGKKQADLVAERGWTSGRASKVWNGKIPFKRELVAEMAEWLGIEPFELFLTPKRAEGLRRLRATAQEIVEASQEAS